MVKLALIRHGESQWNQKNIFTGWVDVDLSDNGMAEATSAGILLAKRGYQFDYAYASVLKRSIRSLWLVLDKLDQMWLPVTYAWQLNERHYGALQGLNKQQVLKRAGPEQFKLWRRSFATPPPTIKPTDKYYIPWDRRYQGLAKNQMPRTESLSDTCQRVWPYWQSNIAPRLLAGQNVIIAAHGNSLRALIKNLNHISDDAISELEIPTGSPFIFEFKKSKQDLKKVSDFYLK